MREDKVTAASAGAEIKLRFNLVRTTIGQAKDFNLDIHTQLTGRGVTAIFGPSGSGKTTLLRCIAGLEHPQRSELIVGEQRWEADGFRLPTHKRPLGYVFQEASLFPHLDVAGNLDYAVKRASKQPHVANDSLFGDVLELMQLQDLLQRYPAQLSGGQRQRVAIARALLARPRLLLMDEPLASLDESSKREILPFLKQLRLHSDFPILYVTHSLQEISSIADHMLLLRGGRLEAQGAVAELLSRLDLPLARERDASAILSGEIVERDNQWQLSRVKRSGGDLWVKDEGDATGELLRLRIQARDVSLCLSEQPDSSIVNRLPVEVMDIAEGSDPSMAMVRLKSGDEFLLASITQRSVAHLSLHVGMRLWAQIKSAAVLR